SLHGEAASVKVVELPGLPERGDVSDFLASGGTVAQLEDLASKAPEWKPGGFVGFVGASNQVQPVFQSEPKPITVELLPVPPLDPLMIPESLRAWIEDIAERGSFPLEYPAAAAITGLSGLIGKRLAVRPKRFDDWLVVPNLWGAVVGPPGLQKTPAVEEALRPLKRLQAEAIEAHEEANKRFQADLMVAEAKKDATQGELKKAAKRGGSDSELLRLAQEATASSAVEEPKLKRYLVNDATVEKLGELLGENPYGLTCFRDELVGFFRMMDRQGHESDRAFYLESWNGSGSFAWDRIGRGTIIIPNVCLSIFGTIQPGPLSRYLRGSASGYEADGFVPRFQILVYPDASAFRSIDRYPNTAAKNRAFDVFAGISELNPVDRGANYDEDRGTYYLGLSQEGQELFDEWRLNLENRLRSGNESTLLVCHLSKYRKLLPALSLIFHLIDSHNRSRIEAISLRAVAAAAAWCELLEAHAKRVYQSALDGDPDAAMQLGERIKASLPNPFTFRQVAQKGWSNLSTVEDVRKAVGILEDRGWVKVVEDQPSQTGGRPSEKVWINPAIKSFDQAEEQS
ncbi:MAG: DUF3987 domain-containing protein, partial [Planctomycetaceae bacterium]|nr:DUF3987 domain-containing protein [Planctomycetaceae bacterium]